MDLGTNTFHLLIAESSSSSYKAIVHEQDPVKLGEGGINKGLIQPAAFERGIKTMQHFKALIDEQPVAGIKAIATSALRNAANGQDFINQVKLKAGIEIEIINGDTEAAYIYKGIKASGLLSGQESLIMDIGGGSVEFIICNKDQIHWKHSFEIGAARLMDRFHHTDPIPPESINALNIYLEDCLKPLLSEAGEYDIANLIGSSGVFESFSQVIEKQKGNEFDLKHAKQYQFAESELLKVIEKIVLSTHQERAANQDILPIRVDMIVTASLLTRFILNKLEIGKVVMSTSSLKEGVLAEMMG